MNNTAYSYNLVVGVVWTAHRQKLASSPIIVLKISAKNVDNERRMYQMMEDSMTKTKSNEFHNYTYIL